MKKITILILLLSISFSQVLAQNSAAEARAAYLLAEEAYAASNWKAALTYLEQCKSKLGRANSKILYLQLMTEMELAKSDGAYYTAAEKTIAAFEKAPDVKSFNEDKVLEVMKTKLRIKELKETKLAQEKAAEEAKRKAAEREKRMAALGGIIVYEKDGHGLVMSTVDLGGKMYRKQAIKACEDLVHNGFDDWYMPSEEELTLMAPYLKKEKNDYFKERDWYWSSTMINPPYPRVLYLKKDNATSQGPQGVNRGYARPVRRF